MFCTTQARSRRQLYHQIIYVEFLFALWRQQLVGRLASIC